MSAWSCGRRPKAKCWLQDSWRNEHRKSTPPRTNKNKAKQTNKQATTKHPWRPMSKTDEMMNRWQEIGGSPSLSNVWREKYWGNQFINLRSLSLNWILNSNARGRERKCSLPSASDNTSAISYPHSTSHPFCTEEESPCLCVAWPKLHGRLSLQMFAKLQSPSIASSSSSPSLSGVWALLTREREKKIDVHTSIFLFLSAGWNALSVSFCSSVCLLLCCNTRVDFPRTIGV